MNILIAPNSMKGSINAFDFADIIEDTIHKHYEGAYIKKIPVADGGDLTGEILARNLNGRKIGIIASGPLGRRIGTTYFIAGRTAIIEMANISGLCLLKEHELNPLKTSSYGVGELILDAYLKGCTEIILGIGGSATIDGGMGMLEALGCKFYTKDSQLLSGNGGNLKSIHRIEFSSKIPTKTKFTVLSDVKNKLLGKSGAATVFGPQKGGTKSMIIDMESGLENWSHLLYQMSGMNITDFPGSGAAGGIATGLAAFYNASIKIGAEYIFELLKFNQAAQWADVIITGEGKLDSQSLQDKAPFMVAKYGMKYKKPVYAIVGRNDLGDSKYFEGIYELAENDENVSYAIENVNSLVQQNVIKLIRILGL